MLCSTAVVNGKKVVVVADADQNKITVTEWDDLLSQLADLRDDLKEDQHVDAAAMLTTIKVLLEGAV